MDELDDGGVRRPLLVTDLPIPAERIEQGVLPRAAVAVWMSSPAKKVVIIFTSPER